MRQMLAREWQLWPHLVSCAQKAKMVKWDKRISIKRRDENNMYVSQDEFGRLAQASLILKRGHTSMNAMVERFASHPLAVVSSGDQMPYLFLDGKSGPECHESEYNVKFCTVLGFHLTFGYDRHKQNRECTHSWVVFGKNCTSRWQCQLGIDFMLKMVGFKCFFGSHMRANIYRPLGLLVATFLDGESIPFGDRFPVRILEKKGIGTTNGTQCSERRRALKLNQRLTPPSRQRRRRSPRDSPPPHRAARQ